MRVLRWTLAALLSHWRRHPLQFFSIFAGLWLATTLWTGVQALNSQARADYARASEVVSAPADAYLVPRAGKTIDQLHYLSLRSAGLKVSPVLEGRLRFVREQPVSVQLLGIEPLTLPDGAQVAGNAFADFDLAAFTGRPGQAWASPDTLRRLGASAGEQLQTADGQLLPPLLEQDRLAPGVIVVDIGHAQRVLGLPNAMSRLLLAEAAVERAQALPEPHASRLRLEVMDKDGELQRLTDSFHLNLTALGLLAFIVGLFIVHASIGLAFEQRRALIRTLRSCGVSLAALMAALVLELGLLAVLGGVMGVITGYGLAAWLLPDVAASLSSLYGAEVAGELSLSFTWWLGGIAISLLGVLLAGINTLVRAARLPVLALAQPEAWRAMQANWLRRQAAAAVVLVLIGLLAWRMGSTLAHAFAMVAAWLLAAALLLPVVLDLILAAVMRLGRGPLTLWFVADSRQQLPALSLALMALLLALGSSVGVGSMTEGFRQTFVGWLDQRLAADLYLTPNSTEQGLQMQVWLQGQPEVVGVAARWRAQATLPVGIVELQGVEHGTRMPSHWPLLQAAPNAWQDLTTQPAAMLSEQLARRLDVGVGDTVQLPVVHHQELRVVALYADYGNPRGHMLVGADWLRQNFSDAHLASLALYVDGAGTENLQQQLHDRFALDSTRMVEQASIKKWSVDVFERTFAATGALNLLTLAVAGGAMFISMLTLGTGRLAQLAPLWAIGVPRRRLAWLTLAQTLVLAALTVVFAIPLGLLLAWCLVEVVNVYAFGWRLPLYVFPQQLALLAGLGLLTSLLAAVVPVGRLARRRPAELLREFSRET